MKEESRLRSELLCDTDQVADNYLDGKRKAEEEPSSPTPSKRIKTDEEPDEVTDKKPKIKPIPFPEKVCALIKTWSNPCLILS